jgi:hypothetical protein
LVSALLVGLAATALISNANDLIPVVRLVDCQADGPPLACFTSGNNRVEGQWHVMWWVDWGDVLTLLLTTLLAYFVISGLVIATRTLSRG